jgi:hypothetical protein
VVNDIENWVIKTTGSLWPVIEDKSGLRDRLLALKAHVSPSEYARQLEAEHLWRSACKAPTSTKIEIWLDQWEIALKKAQVYNLPEVADIRPTRQFLESVKSLAPSFQASPAQPKAMRYHYFVRVV